MYLKYTPLTTNSVPKCSVLEIDFDIVLSIVANNYSYKWTMESRPSKLDCEYFFLK